MLTPAVTGAFAVSNANEKYVIVDGLVTHVPDRYTAKRTSACHCNPVFRTGRL